MVAVLHQVARQLVVAGAARLVESGEVLVDQQNVHGWFQDGKVNWLVMPSGKAPLTSAATDSAGTLTP